jgi:pimeloyl-ACP methyl ester carboxylesterase
LSSTRDNFLALNGPPQAALNAAPACSPGIEECWAEIDGARIRYLRAGSGPPLILLHGLMGYSFSWRYTMPALAPYATVFAPDLLGAGFSDRPKNLDHSMRGTARRVLKFADQLGIESFDLLGTSRGGAVAMAAAAESMRAAAGKPQVRRLVLVCPLNPYSPHGRWLAPFFATRPAAAMFRLAIDRMSRLFPFFHSRLYADRAKIPPGTLEGYKAPLAIPGLFDHALSIVKTWTADLQELEALLPKLAPIPTLLMWGSKDPAVYVSSLEPLARHFRHVETVVFKSIGHLPYEECADKFNQALIQFLVGPKATGEFQTNANLQTRRSSEPAQSRDGRT